jgi:hypothetical protein
MTAMRVEGFQFERVADEILAVEDSTSKEAHALNQSAAAVFDLCDGQSSKAQMATEVRRRTGLPADEEIVDLALAELHDAGLVDLEGQETPPNVARRSLIRRLGLSTAAAMTLPVVETVLLPAGAMAEICEPHTRSPQRPPTPTPTVL